MIYTNILILYLITITLTITYASINKKILFDSLKATNINADTIDVTINLPTKLRNKQIQSQEHNNYSNSNSNSNLYLNSICIYDKLEIKWNNWCDNCVLGVYNHIQNVPKEIQMIDICEIYDNNPNSNSNTNSNTNYNSYTGICTINTELYKYSKYSNQIEKHQ